jgi:predicted nucleotidyltransferase
MMEESNKEKNTNEQTLELLKNVALVLNENRVNYLVCGSLAFRLVTGEPVVIHDIDIIVHEQDFPKLRELLSDQSLNLDPIQTEFSIHANHKSLVGDDAKPFDVSLDSFEHYYTETGIDIDQFKGMDINGVEVKVARIEDMIRVYKKALKGGNVEKFPEYERKLGILQSLI